MLFINPGDKGEPGSMAEDGKMYVASRVVGLTGAASYSGHFRLVCEDHGSVYAQCRCMTSGKPTFTEPCDERCPQYGR